MNHPLKSLRDYYLDCFRQSITEARTHFDQFTTELLLELPSLKHPEYCYRLYRADIIGKHRGETAVREVNVTAKDAAGWQSAFPTSASVDAALVWNGIEFNVTGTPVPSADLVAWATRWLDTTDSRYDEAAEFAQVIHSITPPKATESGFTLSVDFGSAPTTAFDELLPLLAHRATNVSIGSFFLSNPCVTPAAANRLAPSAQQSRQPPRSLSLGSLPTSARKSFHDK